MMEQGMGPQGGGLAAQQGGGQGMDPAQMQEILQQVVQMLLSGVSPEELLQKGVPQQVIEQAMAIAQQQQAQGQPAPAEQPGGLAGMQTQGI